MQTYQSYIVEVDPELGGVKIEKYAIAHDCGVVVNPLLVEGQIAGGTAQGLGGILLEEIAYDPQGQLLSGSLARSRHSAPSSTPPRSSRSRSSKQRTEPD